MKKFNRFFSTVLTAVMAAGIVASSASVVKAAGKLLDLTSAEETTYTAETKVGDFTYVASDSKNIKVEAFEEPMVAADGKEFTKRMALAGASNAIKFNASKGDKIVAYVLSTGGDERSLGLYSTTATPDESGKVTPVATQPIPDKNSAIGVATFEVPADGEYYIATLSKGARLYYLSVGDVSASATTAPKKDNVPKTGIISTAAVCGAVALAGVGVSVVTGKKKEN